MNFAAVDLGAESGRVVRGRFDGERVSLDVAHRFDNRPVRLPDGLRWNPLGLLREIVAALRGLDGPLAGVAVDTWGVDYALLDDGGRVLGLPFHYRDSRTDGMVTWAHERVPREELYAVTGIQTMPINTVYQLDRLLAVRRAGPTRSPTPPRPACWTLGPGRGRVR